MLHQPQHIKRRCSQKVFASITNGERTFELVVDDDVRLDPGDIITYEEYDDEAQRYTGRRESRKVSYVLNTKDLKFPDDELVRYGISICGTVVPEFRTLRSVIDFGSIVSCVIHAKGGGDWEYASEPSYIPVFMTPPVMELGLEQDLQFGQWPVGVFDVTLMVFAAEGRMEFEVIDHAIFAAIRTDDPQKPVISIEMDFTALTKGKAVSISGEDVELAPFDEVTEIVDDMEAEGVSPTLSDEFERQVKELLPDDPNDLDPDELPYLGDEDEEWDAEEGEDGFHG